MAAGARPGDESNYAALPTELLTSLYLLTYLPYVLAGVIVFVSTVFAVWTIRESNSIPPPTSTSTSALVSRSDLGSEGSGDEMGKERASVPPGEACTFRNDAVEKQALYRRSRDAFRGNGRAMQELEAWKRREEGWDYREINGLVSVKMVGQDSNGPGKPPVKWKKCDSFFCEFTEHNPPSLILSSTPSSLIIANHSTHDSRQYPSALFPTRFPNAESTPEGQGFGHMLVIPDKRIFNIVDPEAVQMDCAVVSELVQHFVGFWEGWDMDVIGKGKVGGEKAGEGRKERAQKNRRNLLAHMWDSFEKANQAREEAARAVGGAKQERQAKLQTIKFKEEWEDLERGFLKLNATGLGTGAGSLGKGGKGDVEAGDFVMGFHPWKHNSVGHLHLHVFPRDGRFRQWSARRHDWKTIPVEDVLAVDGCDN